MIKPAFALALLAAAAVAGCSAEEPAPAPATTVILPSLVPATPATTASPSSPAATTTASTGGVRSKSCRDVKPFLDELRAQDPASVGPYAETLIQNLATTPDWATTSAADRQATIDGIHDAAAGKCQ